MIQISYYGNNKLNLSSSHINFKGSSQIHKFPYDSLLKQIVMLELRILHTRRGNSKTRFFLPGCNQLCPHRSYLGSLDASIPTRFGNGSMIISPNKREPEQGNFELSCAQRSLKISPCTSFCLGSKQFLMHSPLSEVQFLYRNKLMLYLKDFCKITIQ